MCGIAGCFGIESPEPLLRAMNDAQAHRGPDGEGIAVDGAVGLAHRRLAIIDRADGAQPMTSADGTSTIVYNGEVYNYLELRDELEGLGHTFTTHSDTEVVLQAYQEWGTAAFDRFNGMFGFAIHDKAANKLVLARDHFGIKPLYVASVDGRFLFASEIKAILATGLVTPEPNDRIIYRYLKFRIHEDDRETFFTGIERLLPGEMVEIDATGAHYSMFTTLPDDLNSAANKRGEPYGKQAVQRFRDELETSVRLRLQSEVPVGTSLSGGLDSSAVVAFINRLMRREAASTESVGTRQNTFSAVFPGSVNDEESYVDAVLDQCGDTVAGHKIKPTADDFKADLYDFVRTQEEPTISTGPYAQYSVMRRAREDVTVLLDGQGADEFMAGYIPYYFVYFRQLRKAGEWGTLLKEITSSLDVLFRLGRFRIAGALTRKKQTPVTALLDKKFQAHHKDERFAVIQDNLKARLAQDLFHNSLPSLLRYEDRNTMRYSIEGRVPFLDPNLVRYLFTLEDAAIIHAGWNKRILRDATRGVLPDKIRQRRNKIGFTTPESEWFLRLKNHLYSIFMSEEFAARPYFNSAAVVESFEKYIQGRSQVQTMMFWRILNVELWLREFIDPKPDQVEPAPPREPLQANPGKNLDIATADGAFRRYPITTGLVSADDKIDLLVREHVQQFFRDLTQDKDALLAVEAAPWHLFISEKIIAIMQGRSYFIADMKPSRAATFLSRFVTRTPAGIGLGSPYTMHLAIKEVGLPRVAFAALGGAVGKLIGKKGLFYELVGGNVRAIDGPTEYSAYPANVSAKLAPKDPDGVARRITAIIKECAPADFAARYAGTVVIDANDIGQNVLGKDAVGEESRYAAVFKDNPLGQARELTPMCAVFELPRP